MGEKGSNVIPAGISASQLEWIQIKEELDATYNQSFWNKLHQKTGGNPFVPIGCLATVGCLGYGLYNMKTGNKVMSQKMMRYRVGAQAFTIAAILLGVMLTTAK